jgi:hypothetical protein
MDEKVDYKKLLEDAAWDADPDFDYKIEFKNEKPNNVLVARGKINIKDPFNKTEYSYNFSIGVDGDILFSNAGRSKKTENGYLLDIDLRKRVHDEIITFNENLATSIGIKKIIVNNEESERVRQLYFSRGYSISSVNDSAKNLEKILK